jgi:hypothetical protein
MENGEAMKEHLRCSREPGLEYVPEAEAKHNSRKGPASR